MEINTNETITKMKKIYLLLTLISLLQNGYAQSDYTDLTDFKPDNKIKNRSLVASENCNFYLKHPPVISSFYNIVDSWEKVKLFIKDGYSNYDVEMSIKFHFYNTQDNYTMYDDGTHGDSIPNDLIYTNDHIYFPHKEFDWENNKIKTMSYCPITIYINYRSNSSLIHTDEVWMDFWNVNPDFLATLKAPAVKYLNGKKSVIWSDNFIFINKLDNWHQLNTQQHGAGCWFDYEYIESESILYDYWEKSQIINNLDDKFYLQVDFLEPSGQYSYPDGERVYLNTHGLFGPLVHELLHRWNVSMNGYLGFNNYNDTFSGHYAGICRNTSGFLYQGYGRFPWMYCEGAEKNVVRENDSTYSLIYHETCEKGKNRQIFNDYEQYIMGILAIDSVKFPIYFLNGFKKFEEKIDPVTGFSLDTFKVFFKELVEIDKPKLAEARRKFLEDHPGNQEFLSGDTIRAIPVFNWTSNATTDELKIINFFCTDIAKQGPTDINMNYAGGDFITYYEATQRKGIIVTDVPKPQLLIDQREQIRIKSSSKSLILYPNPVKAGQEFDVEIDALNSDLGSAKLSVSSSTGVVLLQKTDLQQHISQGGLARGVYLVQIRFKNGESLTRKLIVH
jgi:hypothetical protein